MFQNLSDKLTNVFSNLTRKGLLTEEDVNLALREVRIALLEADVSLPVVKTFVSRVKEIAIGTEVLKSISPGQMVIKVVSDELKELLGGNSAPLNIQTKPPAVIMMAGLQGSGKTTTTAKIALKLSKENKKVLVASLDVYRPAAMEQLKILSEKIDVDCFDIEFSKIPLEIAKAAQKKAKLEGYDVLLLDTAGRLHIDHQMMGEIQSISSEVKPAEILLIADAMTGQDAVNIAKEFKDRLNLTGVILTRMDGDARGGAALTMVTATGCPIKFVGTGEHVDSIEVFHPERVAQRILGMGDVVSLVEKASEVVDKEDAEKLNKKLQKGIFTLSDMAEQMRQTQKMGGLTRVLDFLPGVGGLKEKLGSSDVDDKKIKRQIAIVESMTPKERRYPKLLNASRKRRVAGGAGVLVQDINTLLKQHEAMGKMLKKMKKLGKRKFLAHGMKDLLP